MASGRNKRAGAVLRTRSRPIGMDLMGTASNEAPRTLAIAASPMKVDTMAIAAAIVTRGPKASPKMGNSSVRVIVAETTKDRIDGREAMAARAVVHIGNSENSKME